MTETIKTSDQYRAEWVKALRSGDYAQCKGHLGDDEGAFCCLGVATDLAMKDGLVTEGVDFELIHAMPPRRVSEAFDMFEGGLTSIVDSGGYLIAAYELNDRWELTFEEIADLIEEGVLLTAAGVAAMTSIRVLRSLHETEEEA